MTFDFLNNDPAWKIDKWHDTRVVMSTGYTKFKHSQTAHGPNSRSLMLAMIEGFTVLVWNQKCVKFV